jgi:hypothetical protein
VSAALTPPFAVAALLLCVAGALKLRSPGPAAAALRTLGWPGTPGIVRALAAGELALGAVCAVHPTRVGAAVLAGAYVTLAGVAAALARRRVACGCFGGLAEDEPPASAVHWIASALLGAVAAVAAAAGSHGIGWVLAREAPEAAVLLIGIAGALYATVLVYTQLPVAWAAWGGE